MQLRRCSKSRRKKNFAYQNRLEYLRFRIWAKLKLFCINFFIFWCGMGPSKMGFWVPRWEPFFWGRNSIFDSGIQTAGIWPTRLYAIERGRLGLSKSGLGFFWSCLSSEKSALFWEVGATIDLKYKVGFNDWKMLFLRAPSHFSNIQNLCKSASISLKFWIWGIQMMRETVLFLVWLKKSQKCLRQSAENLVGTILGGYARGYFSPAP